MSADSNDFVAIANAANARGQLTKFNDDDPSGETRLREVQITINDDNPGLCESYETFNVYLTNVIGGVLGEQSWARVKIIDDDSKYCAIHLLNFHLSDCKGKGYT